MYDVVPKCCGKGWGELGYDFKMQRMLKKIRDRKSGPAMAGPAGPPATPEKNNSAWYEHTVVRVGPLFAISHALAK